MVNPVFTIKDLHCGYAADRPVLSIEHLAIPRGEIVFVVGVSGGGKSTLIETLGLMNRTTEASGLGGSVEYVPAGGSPGNLLKLWGQGDAALSAFRQRHFSFIFQQTNLMPNFSSGENMLLTAMLAGQDKDVAEVKVRALMRRIDLPDRAFEAPIQELSGGQRQRLAFIRALVAEYEVLFGDEPTGNLDNATARQCLRLLRDELTSLHRTAVIVSHDIALAVEFADLIIPIALVGSPTGGRVGKVDEDRILHRGVDGHLLTRAGRRAPDAVADLSSQVFN